MIKELNTVVMTEDLPEHGLKGGPRGGRPGASGRGVRGRVRDAGRRDAGRRFAVRPGRCASWDAGRSPRPERRVVEEGGFREFYDPYAGQPHGAPGFGWSVLVVDMIAAVAGE